MHIHLDTVGGISGNMFVGAMLECWPELAVQLQQQIEKAGFAELVKLHTEKKNDGVLSGTYFYVEEIKEYGDRRDRAKDREKRDRAKDLSLHAGRHAHYSEIRDSISASQLDEKVKVHALGIFRCLAEAEAEVHGKQVEAVAFHEIGAWDSIADIISAAFLIEGCDADSWSVSSLPLGRGQVKTAHGMLPIPAPAVTLLLQDFQFYDDGLEGERVTPTGAAILKYLQANNPGPSTGLTLRKSGFGFGSHVFPGISNVLRVMVFSDVRTENLWQEDQVLELVFDVDDQSPEHLALGLDRVRKVEGVLDINQRTVTGKKQRGVIQVQLLAEKKFEQKVITACFNETTTLGIRKELISRAVLPRKQVSVRIDNRNYRAKIVERPNGELTAKAELDDYAREDLSHKGRELLRQQIEALAVESRASENFLPETSFSENSHPENQDEQEGDE